MRPLVIAGAVLLLIATQIACCCSITLPRIDVHTPSIEVGEMHEMQQSIPLEGDGPFDVDVTFGAGRLEMAAGEPDSLLSGHFRYNVDDWEPQIALQGDTLSITQSNTEGTELRWPTGNVHNQWNLALSPAVPLAVALDAGAGDGDLDLSGLQIEALDLDLGAGDFEIHFDEPNGAQMSELAIDVGAARLQATGLGNASPRELYVQSGAGDVVLALTGEWSNSCAARITAGAGSLTLRLPDDVGVRVEVTGGVSNVTASGLQKRDGAYVNALHDASEIELSIFVTTGIGQVTLIED